MTNLASMKRARRLMNVKAPVKAALALLLLGRDKGVKPSEELQTSRHCLLLVIAAFFVTECVMIVANVAIDTIFLSALEDYERHDDSSERPYYMNRKLKQLFIKDEYHPISSA